MIDLRRYNCMFAFNVWDIVSAKAVIDAAADLGQNVILQTSTRIFKKMDKEAFALFSKAYAQVKGIQVLLNLDHCAEENVIYDAIDCGWDIVMIDASAQKIEENIRITSSIVEYAHRYNVLVEAEIGQIKGTEEDVICEDEEMASVGDIQRFVERAYPDLLAVAFGNAHGMYQGEANLRYEVIEQVKSICDLPFVVHGGSGMTSEQIRRLVAYDNVKKINISTEMKEAYCEGFMEVEREQYAKRYETLAASQAIEEKLYNKAREKMQLLEVEG